MRRRWVVLLVAVTVVLRGSAIGNRSSAHASSSAICTFVRAQLVGSAGARTYHIDLTVRLSNLRSVKANIVASITDSWGWHYRIGASVGQICVGDQDVPGPCGPGRPLQGYGLLLGQDFRVTGFATINRMGESGKPLRGTFDSAADLYEAARPSYPGELIEDLVRVSDLQPGDRLLEIGCGSGKATRPLLERGYSIVCVEIGPKLAEQARRNLAGFPVEIQVAPFETWEGEPESFDLVYAATAWH